MTLLNRDSASKGRSASVAAAGALATGVVGLWAWRKLSGELAVAPGYPGKTPYWTSSAKQGVGTSLGSQSNVWFTLHHGIVTEVFFPRADRPAVAEMELVVTSDDGFYSEEKNDATHEIEYIQEGVPLYRLVNTCRRGRYRIEKTIFSHPAIPVVLQHIRFVPLAGPLEDYRLHVLVDPHLGNRGWHNHAWVGDYEGHRMLFAEEDGDVLALGGPWQKVSAGFSGASDGRRQLRRYGRLKQTYRRAPRGNVSLTGEIDLMACDGEFLLALGFGGAVHEAGLRVRRTMLADIDALQAEYVSQWRDWQAALTEFDNPADTNRDLYRASTMVLRTHEDKAVPGAFVASLTIPWGDARKTNDHFGPVGYHVIWPRDLYMIAGGLLAAGDGQAACRALEYCQATQKATGGWPQNQAVSGEARWTGKQLGETSQPVLLFDLVNRAGLLSADDRRRYWPMVRDALGHIVRNGPSAQEDRWEDAEGFTPFTLANMIAALVAGAELAHEQQEEKLARFFLETADAWYADIDYWTYVEDTSLADRVGVPGYYIRVAPTDRRGTPMKYRGEFQLWYRPMPEKDCPPEDMVSPDALAYVRFGLRAVDDPRIENTVKVIDALLKTDTPRGPSWHRYNHDGYGERKDGSPFDGKRGIGRLWPLLTGERAHYELLAGRPDEAGRLLGAVERFAGDGKMLPEQIWDTDDIPDRELYFGRPSGSAMPLAWAHAEYIKLRRSLAEGRVYDLPPRTYRRYVVDATEPRHVVWGVNHRRPIMPAGKVLRIHVNSPSSVSWHVKGGRGGSIPARDTGLGLYYADLPTDDLAEGEVVRFTFDSVKAHWIDKKQWYVAGSGEVRIVAEQAVALEAAR